MAAVPLYLAGGVVITSACQQALGFWGALGVSVLVCSVTKALAIAGLHQNVGAVRTHGCACATMLAALCTTRRVNATPPAIGVDEECGCPP